MFRQVAPSEGPWFPVWICDSRGLRLCGEARAEPWALKGPSPTRRLISRLRTGPMLWPEQVWPELMGRGGATPSPGPSPGMRTVRGQGHSEILPVFLPSSIFQLHPDLGTGTGLGSLRRWGQGKAAPPDSALGYPLALGWALGVREMVRTRARPSRTWLACGRGQGAACVVCDSEVVCGQARGRMELGTPAPPSPSSAPDQQPPRHPGAHQKCGAHLAPAESDCIQPGPGRFAFTVSCKGTLQFSESRWESLRWQRWGKDAQRSRNDMCKGTEAGGARLPRPASGL